MKIQVKQKKEYDYTLILDQYDIEECIKEIDFVIRGLRPLQIPFLINLKGSLENANRLKDDLNVI